MLEAANDMGLDTSRVRRLGIPDQFIEHGERAELLADLQLDAPGIARVCRDWVAQLGGSGCGTLGQRTRQRNEPVMSEPMQSGIAVANRRNPPGAAPASVRLRVLLLGNGQRANVHAEAERLRPADSNNMRTSWSAILTSGKICSTWRPILPSCWAAMARFCTP